MNAQEFFEIGDVIVNTWGYEQTNVDFYEVVKVTAKFVTLQQIGSSETQDAPQAMSGTSVPVIGRYFDGNYRRGVYLYDGEPRVNFQYGSGAKWNGKPVSYSSWA